MGDDDRERWDARYAQRTQSASEVEAALVQLQDWLPAGGQALDIAGGDGRNAVWLASRGLDVTVVDVSSVGLQRADARARAAGQRLFLECRDLEKEPLPAGPWDLVVCVSYVQRDLWSAAADRLAPGGRAVWIHPTAANLERHAKPSRRFLLEAGEARRILAAARPQLRIEHATEGWTTGGRHLACVVATRP